MSINFRKQDTIIYDIKKLDVKDGDVLILRSNNPDVINSHTIADGLAANKLNVTVLVLHTNQDLSTVSSEYMAKHGWVRSTGNVISNNIYSEPLSPELLKCLKDMSSAMHDERMYMQDMHFTTEYGTTASGTYV